MARWFCVRYSGSQWDPVLFGYQLQLSKVTTVQYMFDLYFQGLKPMTLALLSFTFFLFFSVLSIPSTQILNAYMHPSFIQLSTSDKITCIRMIIVKSVFMTAHCVEIKSVCLYVLSVPAPSFSEDLLVP